MSRPTQHLGIFLCSGLLLACGATNTVASDPESETLIAIDPTDFPAAAQCGPDSHVGNYLAEIIDVSRQVVEDGEVAIEPFTVQISPITPCNRVVALSQVVEHREYIVHVKIFADRDGDPGTPDVCAIEGTSITTLPESDGTCSATLAAATQLAAPANELTCYGWRAPDPTSEGGDAAVNAQCDPVSRGCPGAARDHRMVTLSYCVEGWYPPPSTSGSQG